MPRKTEPPICYFDACVFLSLINKTEGRAEIIESILADADRGEKVVYTSVLSQAEVAFSEDEKADKTLDPSIEGKIDALWHPSSPVRMVEVHGQIVKAAMKLNRELVASARKTASGADSIHLATALSVGASEFQTYDKKLISIGPINRMRICEPNNNVMIFEDSS